MMVAIIHVITFAFDLAVFIVALTFTPYTFCSNSSAKGCEMDKAAIAMDGALWYVFLSVGKLLINQDSLLV